MKDIKANSIKHKPSALSVSSLIILIVYSLIFISALLWALSFSFVDFDNQIEYNFDNGNSYLVFPNKFDFRNILGVYEKIKKEVAFGAGTKIITLPEMFLNSLLYALGVSFAGTLAPCIMGYVTAKYNFKFNKIIDTVVIVTLILPIVGALPSQLKVVIGLKLNDSIPGLWIMAFGFANMYYFVFKAIFKSLPEALYESASMDGAGEFKIFLRIMLPLVKTTFSSVMLVGFVAAWNNYTVPLAFAPNKPTAAYGLFTLVQGTRAMPTEKMTGAMILMIPILVAYIFLNKKLMGNLTMGSVKG